MFMLAAMVVATSTAFAQDVKSVLKSKDYAEAKSQLEACLSSLNNEDKAKAYNKLVELSLQKVNKEMAVMSENQVMEQMGQKDGKLKPVDCLQKEDNNGAFNYYAAYVNSGTSALFDDFDKTKSPDTYLGEVARVAGVIAYQAKKMDDANKYIDIALNDTASYKDALGLKMAMMQQSMKTKEDSVKCLKSFEDLYAKDKSETIFTNLATLYGNLNMKDKQMKLINERLASDPNCFTAWAVKGQAEMNESKWDEALADLKKANSIKESALVLTWMGFCNYNKAANLQDVNEQKKIQTETQGYLEKARDLDPNQQEANWKYLLYNTYYVLYGADDSRTKALAPNK